MKTLLSKFISALPSSIKSLALDLNSRGFKVGFIGGVTRDFILKESISFDIDIEIRSSSVIDMNALAKELGGSINNEFKIITIMLNEYSVEIGLPRIESFDPTKKSHKNFTFINSFGYEKEFLRRDFTINAIMFEMFHDDLCLVDPLGGIEDLKVKMLRACSGNFSFDPVRALRAYRFKIQKKFVFSKELVESLKLIDISNCSNYYILSEASKSQRPLTFLKEIGVLSSFNQESLYDNNLYSISYIFDKEPSIADKLQVMKQLGLSLKNALPIQENYQTFYDYIDLFSYFVKHKLSLPEVKYILKHLDFDLEACNLNSLYDVSYNFNAKEMSKEDKKSKFASLILEQISL